MPQNTKYHELGDASPLRGRKAADFNRLGRNSEVAYKIFLAAQGNVPHESSDPRQPNLLRLGNGLSYKLLEGLGVHKRIGSFHSLVSRCQEGHQGIYVSNLVDKRCRRETQLVFGCHAAGALEKGGVTIANLVGFVQTDSPQANVQDPGPLFGTSRLALARHGSREMMVIIVIILG